MRLAIKTMTNPLVIIMMCLVSITRLPNVTASHIGTDSNRFQSLILRILRRHLADCLNLRITVLSGRRQRCPHNRTAKKESEPGARQIIQATSTSH